MISYKKVDLVLTILFVLFGIYLFFIFISILFGRTTESVVFNGPPGSQVFTIDSFDFNPPDPDPGDIMTWGRCKEIERTATLVQQERDNLDRSSGNSFGGLLLTSSSIQDCDSCSDVSSEFNSPKTTRYYVGIAGYRLHPDTVFHFRNGRNYLRYPTWDSVRYRGENRVQYGHFILKEVPFRFMYSDFKNRTWDPRGTVLIPVSKKTYNILSILLPVASGLILLTLLYICLGLPAKILIRIAQGKVFIRQNIRQLYLVTWTIFAFQVMILLGHFVLHLSFSRYFTPDVNFNYSQVIKDNWASIVAAIVFFLIARAFRKGYDLQHEQELTI